MRTYILTHKTIVGLHIRYNALNSMEYYTYYNICALSANHLVVCLSASWFLVHFFFVTHFEFENRSTEKYLVFVYAYGTNKYFFFIICYCYADGENSDAMLGIYKIDRCVCRLTVFVFYSILLLL